MIYNYKKTLLNIKNNTILNILVSPNSIKETLNDTLYKPYKTKKNFVLFFSDLSQSRNLTKKNNKILIKKKQVLIPMNLHPSEMSSQSPSRKIYELTDSTKMALTGPYLLTMSSKPHFSGVYNNSVYNIKNKLTEHDFNGVKHTSKNLFLNKNKSLFLQNVLYKSFFKNKKPLSTSLMVTPDASPQNSLTDTINVNNSQKNVTNFLKINQFNKKSNISDFKQISGEFDLLKKGTSRSIYKLVYMSDSFTKTTNLKQGPVKFFQKKLTNMLVKEKLTNLFSSQKMWNTGNTYKTFYYYWLIPFVGLYVLNSFKTNNYFNQLAFNSNNINNFTFVNNQKFNTKTASSLSSENTQTAIEFESTKNILNSSNFGLLDKIYRSNNNNLIKKKNLYYFAINNSILLRNSVGFNNNSYNELVQPTNSIMGLTNLSEYNQTDVTKYLSFSKSNLTFSYYFNILKNLIYNTEPTFTKNDLENTNLLLAKKNLNITDNFLNNTYKNRSLFKINNSKQNYYKIYYQENRVKPTNVVVGLSVLQTSNWLDNQKSIPTSNLFYFFNKNLPLKLQPLTKFDITQKFVITNIQSKDNKNQNFFYKKAFWPKKPISFCCSSSLDRLIGPQRGNIKLGNQFSKSYQKPYFFLKASVPFNKFMSAPNLIATSTNKIKTVVSNREKNINKIYLLLDNVLKDLNFNINNLEQSQKFSNSKNTKSLFSLIKKNEIKSKASLISNKYNMLTSRKVGLTDNKIGFTKDLPYTITEQGATAKPFLKLLHPILIQRTSNTAGFGKPTNAVVGNTYFLNLNSKKLQQNFANFNYSPVNLVNIAQTKQGSIINPTKVGLTTYLQSNNFNSKQSLINVLSTQTSLSRHKSNFSTVDSKNVIETNAKMSSKLHFSGVYNINSTNIAQSGGLTTRLQTFLKNNIYFLIDSFLSTSQNSLSKFRIISNKGNVSEVSSSKLGTLLILKKNWHFENEKAIYTNLFKKNKSNKLLNFKLSQLLLNNINKININYLNKNKSKPKYISLELNQFKLSKVNSYNYKNSLILNQFSSNSQTSEVNQTKKTFIRKRYLEKLFRHYISIMSSKSNFTELSNFKNPKNKTSLNSSTADFSFLYKQKLAQSYKLSQKNLRIQNMNSKKVRLTTQTLSKNFSNNTIKSSLFKQKNESLFKRETSIYNNKIKNKNSTIIKKKTIDNLNLQLKNYFMQFSNNFLEKNPENSNYLKSFADKRKTVQKKRRKKKLKKETRRRKKRKRFYPRLALTTFKLYKNFLNSSINKVKNSDKTVKGSKSQLNRKYQTKYNYSNLPYQQNTKYFFSKERQLLFASSISETEKIVLKNQLSTLELENEIYNIFWDSFKFNTSKTVLNELRRFSWKSAWMRSNYGPYLNRIKNYFKKLKSSTSKWELFITLKSLNETLKINNLKTLDKNNSNFYKKQAIVGNSTKLELTELTKWDIAFRNSEYNRLLYQRIQDIIFNIKENLTLNGHNQIRAYKNGRNWGTQIPKTKLKESLIEDSFLKKILNLQTKDANAPANSNTVKIQKTLFNLKYAPVLTQYSMKNLTKLRLYWGINKTYTTHKRKIIETNNKIIQTWSKQKLREQSQTNKTKKLLFICTKKIENLLNVFTLNNTNNIKQSYKKNDNQNIKHTLLNSQLNFLSKQQTKEEKLGYFGYFLTFNTNLFENRFVGSQTLNSLTSPKIFNGINLSTYWWSDFPNTKNSTSMTFYDNSKLTQYTNNIQFNSLGIKNYLEMYGQSNSSEIQNLSQPAYIFSIIWFSILLFHFCSLISLIRISQIRCVLKTGIILLGKFQTNVITLLSSTQLTPIFKDMNHKTILNAKSTFNSVVSVNPIKMGFTKPLFLDKKLSTLYINSQSKITPSLRLKTWQFNKLTRLPVKSLFLSSTIRQTNSLFSQKNVSNWRSFIKTKNSYIVKNTLYIELWLFFKQFFVYSFKTALFVNSIFKNQKNTFNSSYSLSLPFIGVIVNPTTLGLTLTEESNNLKTNNLVKQNQKLENTLSSWYSNSLVFKVQSISIFYLKTINFFFKTLYKGSSLSYHLIYNSILGTTSLFSSILSSIFAFFEKPAEVFGDWLAFAFLVEWSSDLSNTIPEKFDYSIYSSFSKSIRPIKMIPVVHNRFLKLFDIFVETLCQPDTDLITRQKKGFIFWDIWADYLIQIAEKSNINIAALSNNKEEQNTLLSFLLKSQLPSQNNNMLTNLDINAVDPRSLKWSVNQFLTSSGLNNNNASSAGIQNLFIDIHPPKSLRTCAEIKNYSIFYTNNKTLTKSITGFLPSKNEQPIGTLVCQVFSGIFYKQVSKNLLILSKANNSERDKSEKSLLVQAIAGETELRIITDNAYRYSIVHQGVAVGIKLLRDVFDAIALHTPCLFLLEDIHAIGERRPLLISDGANTESNTSGSEREGFPGGLDSGIHEKNQVLYQLSKHMITHYRKPFKGDFSLSIPTNIFSFDLFLGSTKYSLSESNKSLGKNLKINNNKQKIGLFNKNNVGFMGRTQESVKLGSTEHAFNSNKPFLNVKHLLNNLNQSSPIKTFSQYNITRVQKSPIKLKWNDINSQSSTNNNTLKNKTLLSTKLEQKSNPLLAPPATSPFSVLILKEQNKKLNINTIVDELPWEGLPAEQLAIMSKSNYSLRVKIALLADLAMSNLSVKLDMITDLLVIIDSVRGNRGFVVFATTHLPFILDPALRRPGRLDETLTLAITPTLFNKWEFLKAKTLNSSKQEKVFEGNFNNLSKNLSLSSSVNSFILYNSINNNDTQSINNLIYQKSLNINKQAILNSYVNSFVQTGENEYNTSDSIYRLLQTKIDQFIFKQKKEISLSEINKKAKNLTSNQQYSKILREKNSRYLLKQNISAIPILTKQRLKSELGIYLENKYAKIFIKNLGVIPVRPFIKQESSIKLDVSKKSIIKKLKMKINTISIKTYSFITQLIFTQQINTNLSNTGNKIIDVPFTSLEVNDLNTHTSKSEIFISLYSSNVLLKQYILKLLIGFIFSQGNSSKRFKHSNVIFNQENNSLSYSKENKYFENKKQETLTKLVNTYFFDKKGSGYAPPLGRFTTQHNFSLTPNSTPNLHTSKWENNGLITSLIYGFIQKRYVYQKNLMIPQLLSLGYSSKGGIPSLSMDPKELPSPPSSNILLPAKKYENFKRFNFFSFNQSKEALSIDEKIQNHNRQLLLKDLYAKTSTNFNKQTYLLTSLKNEFLQTNTKMSSGNLPTSTSWYYRNRIYNRHKNYLINLWSNAQLPEHNIEATFLSDIDWRSKSFKATSQGRVNSPLDGLTKTMLDKQVINKKTKKMNDIDCIIDFPDADQYYNPRNRRWLLTSGTWNSWFEFNKTEQIINSYISESLAKICEIITQNNEILDYLVINSMSKTQQNLSQKDLYLYSYAILKTFNNKGL